MRQPLVVADSVQRGLMAAFGCGVCHLMQSRRAKGPGGFVLIAGQRSDACNRGVTALPGNVLYVVAACGMRNRARGSGVKGQLRPGWVSRLEAATTVLRPLRLAV